MHSLRQKWELHKTYRRLKKLWEDYKAVASVGDFKVSGERLARFLDLFQQSFQELTGSQAKIDLDKVYGDCTEILTAVVDFVEREASADKEVLGDSFVLGLYDLINKSLSVAELILQDEKYRVVVKDTPHMIGRLLDLLDKVETTEAKRIALRVISTVGKTDANKLEIGRLDGFRKILRLLVEGDEELKKEILKTIRKMLDVHKARRMETISGQDASSPSAASSSPSSASDSQSSSAPGSSSSSASNRLSRSSFGDFAKDKINSIVNEVSKVLYSEIHKIFPSSARGSLEDEQQLAAVAASSADANSSSNAADSFPPSYQDVEEEMKILAVELSEEYAAAEAVGESHSSSSLPSASLSSSFNASDDTLRELMMMQGALSALLQSLMDAAMTVQLDVMQTISKIVFNNPRSQQEMRNADGYSVLARIFEFMADFSTSESIQFLQSSFDLFFTIVLDGSKNRRVGNFDALGMLFDIVGRSSHHQVRMEALRCIQDLLIVNPLNIVYMKHVNGIAKLFLILKGLATATFAPSSPNGNSNNSNNRKQEDAILFARTVAGLLNLMAVILSNHNLGIPFEYVSLLDDFAEPSAPQQLAESEECQQIQLLILRSFSALLADLSARGKRLDRNTAAAFVTFFVHDVTGSLGASASMIPAARMSMFQMSPVSQQQRSSSGLSAASSSSSSALVLDAAEAEQVATGSGSSSDDEEEVEEQYISATKNDEEEEENDDQNNSKNNNNNDEATAVCKCLLILECLGHVLKDNSEAVELFCGAGGLKALSSLVGAHVPECVVDAALWLLMLLFCSSTDSVKFAKVFARLFASHIQSPSVLVRITEVLTSTMRGIEGLPHGSAFKISIRETGVLATLVEFFASSQGVLSTASALAIGEAVTNCESNKVYIGERLGFERFGHMVTEQMELSALLFGLSVELATSGSFRSVLKHIPQLPSGVSAAQMCAHTRPALESACKYLGNVLSPRPLFESLPVYAWAAAPPPISPSASISDLKEAAAAAAAASAANPSSSSSSPSAPVTSPTRLLRYSRIEAFMSEGNVSMPSLFSASSASLSSSSSASLEDLANASPLLGSGDSLVASPASPSSFDEPRPSRDSFSLSLSGAASIPSSASLLVPTPFVQRPKKDANSESSSSSSSSSSSPPSASNDADDNNDDILVDDLDRNIPLLVRIVLRSDSSCRMLLNVLKSCSAQVQHRAIKYLLVLLDANPANLRRMCSAKAVQRLVQLARSCPDDLQLPYLQVVAAIASYSVTPEDVSNLFSVIRTPSSALASTLIPPSTPRDSAPDFDNAVAVAPDVAAAAAAQKQSDFDRHMLFVLGRVAETQKPSNFFHLDGIDGYMCVGPFDRFPAAKTGYSFGCWLRLGHIVLTSEPTLFAWHHNGAQNVFRAFFRKNNPKDAVGATSFFRYTFCVSIMPVDNPRAAQVVEFDLSRFGEGGDWHHVVFSHSQSTVSLYVDGQHLQSHPSPYFPADISKTNRLMGYIGCTFPPAELGGWRVESFVGKQGGNLFGGCIGPICILEGFCDAVAALKWFNDGFLPSNDLRTFNLTEFVTVSPESGEAASPSPSPAAAPSFFSSLLSSSSVTTTVTAVQSPHVPSADLSASSSADPQSASEYSANTLVSPRGSNSSAFSSSAASASSFSDLSQAKTVPAASPQQSSKESISSSPAAAVTSSSSSLAGAVPPASPMKIAASMTRKGLSTLSLYVKGGVDIHCTFSMRDILPQVGGLSLVLPLVAAAPVAGLRILHGLLDRSRVNSTEFTKLDGFCVLYVILASSARAQLQKQHQLALEGLPDADSLAAAAASVEQMLPISPDNNSDSSSEHICLETFDVMLDIICTAGVGLTASNAPRRNLTKTDGLFLFSDLLRLCPSNLQFQVIRTLSDLITQSPENLKAWRQQGPGLTCFLDLYALPACIENPALNSIVLGMIEKLLLDALPTEMEQVVGEICEKPSASSSAPTSAASSASSASEPSPSSHGDANNDGTSSETGSNGDRNGFSTNNRVLLVHSLYEMMRTSPTFMDAVCAHFGLHFVFSLMESHIEDIRVLAIKMLGLQLSANSKIKAVFTKGCGFDTVFVHLSQHRPTAKVISKLFGLLLSSFTPAPKAKIAAAPAAPAKGAAAAAAASSPSTPAAPVSQHQSSSSSTPSASVSSSTPSQTPASPSPESAPASASSKPAPAPPAAGAAAARPPPAPASAAGKGMADRAARLRRRVTVRTLSFQQQDGSAHIVYPDVARIILELLALSDDEDLHLQVLDGLEKLMEPPNTGLLLEFSLLDWLATYFQQTKERIAALAEQHQNHIAAAEEVMSPALSSSSSFGAGINGDEFPSANAVFERQQTQFFNILKRVTKFDISRNPNQSKLRAVKNMCEAQDFQVLLLEAMLDVLEHYPRLSEADGGPPLRNVAIWLENIEECIPLSAALCMRIIAVVNMIASENSAAVRGRMKALDIFQRRDELMLHLLRTAESLRVRIGVLSNLSFETLADQPSLRDPNTLLFLLTMLRDAMAASEELPGAVAAVVRVIRFVCLGPQGEECKKALAKFVDDREVFDRLLSPRPSSSSSASSAANSLLASIPVVSDSLSSPDPRLSGSKSPSRRTSLELIDSASEDNSNNNSPVKKKPAPASASSSIPEGSQQSLAAPEVEEQLQSDAQAVQEQHIIAPEDVGSASDHLGALSMDPSLMRRSSSLVDNEPLPVERSLPGRSSSFLGSVSSNSIASAVGDDSRSAEDEMEIAEDAEERAEDFLNWYYDDSQRVRREAVEARIAKLWSQIEGRLTKKRDSASALRERTAKSRRDEMSKVRTEIMRKILDFEDKRRAFMLKLLNATEKTKTTYGEDRHKRAARGVSSWSAILATVSKLNNDNQSPSPTATLPSSVSEKVAEEDSPAAVSSTPPSVVDGISE